MNKQLQNVAKKFDIDLLYLFGSQAAGNATKQSDVDIAYHATHALSWKTMHSLTEALRPILQTTSEIDLVDMTTAPPLLAYQIATKGKKLIGANKVDERFYRKAVTAYYDARPLFQATKNYIYDQIKILTA